MSRTKRNTLKWAKRNKNNTFLIDGAAIDQPVYGHPATDLCHYGVSGSVRFIEFYGVGVKLALQFFTTRGSYMIPVASLPNPTVAGKFYQQECRK